MRLVHPENNAIVASRMVVTVRTPARSRCRIKIFIDGGLARRQRCGSKRVHKAHVPVANLPAGRHKVRVLVQRGDQRKSRRVEVRVVKTLPSPLEGIPSDGAESFDLIFTDNFDKAAALGSMGSDSSPSKVVYTGSGGTRWVTYPRTYVDTIEKRPYRSDGVLSVHDGTLDFWLHNVDGEPAGASPSPLLDGSSQYQTFGRYSVRLKVDSVDLPEYYMAWLLWPSDEGAWDSAESDFPEQTLDSSYTGVDGYSHDGPGPTVKFRDESSSIHGWHTYTQDWTPIARRYYIDGQLIGTAPAPIYGAPERWQLQTETRGDGNSSGHILVDWVSVYSYSPQ
jgi:hypothetical protein